MEVWKDVVGYEGFYQVSNLGNVKSFAREVPYKTYGTWKMRTVPGRIMKPYKNESGYLLVTLTKPDSRKLCKVHRIVAEAFIENPESKRCVNHKDGNKENNCVENLEWVTYSENMHHAADNELWVSWNKGKHPEGRPRSDETRRKISEANIGKAHHTQKHTEETKRKISEILKGKMTGAEHPRAKTVKCVETGVIYSCVAEAERFTGVKHSHICSVCTGKRKSAGKLHWEYVKGS